VTTTTVVSDTALPTVTASVSNTLTVAQPTATISTTASAGVTYEWSTGQTTPGIVVNSSGTYSVTVTSANGCTAVTTTTVVSDTALPSVTAVVSNDLTCSQPTATISTTASPGVTYLWSNGATTASISVSVAGAYSVTVTAQNGATASVMTTVVSDTALPALTTTVSNTLTCAQATATITATTDGIAYLWSTGETTASISVSAAGPYSVTVTGANGCSATTTTTVVSDTALPTVTASVSNTLTVAQPTATISTTASPADVTYEWSTGATTPSIVVNSSGTYSVTVTSANGCTAATTTTVVSDTALPSVTAVVSNDLSCTALTATISTSASPGVSYLWSTGETTASISVSVAGPYSVTVTAQNGATASVMTSVFSNTAAPTIDVTAPEVCAGETLVLTGAISTTGASYRWTGPNNFTAATAVVSISNATTANSGSYTLTVTDPATGCSSTTIVEGVVNALPDSFSLIAKEATCSGGNSAADGQISIANYGAGDRYDISAGSSYTGVTSYALAKPIPAGGVIVPNIIRNGVQQTYVVRVYSEAGCFAEQTVTIQNVPCECPADVCVPVIIKKTRVGQVIRPTQRFYGLTGDNQLMQINTQNPQVANATVTLTGLQAGESMLAIDFRPATGQLYGVSSGNRIYVIDPATGASTAVGATPFSTTISATSVGLDFNPTVDRIRFVTNTGVNLRLNPITGGVAATDNPINGVDGATISAVAYTNNRAGATTTTLYDIDPTSDQLLIQTPPNNGTLVPVGSLGVDITSAGGFDISPSGSIALVAVVANGANELHQVNLSTGKLTKLGNLPASNVIGLAIPVQP
jgi:hypothetical protein